jgi:hypothetical protein
MKLAEILNIWRDFLLERTPKPCLSEDESLEEEEFQDVVKKQHKSMKKRLIKLGKQKNTPPYEEKTTLDRSKNAPAKYGGS